MGTERPRGISPHTNFDIAKHSCDSASPNIIFHPRCVSVDASFDTLHLQASVYSLPAGRFFLRSFCCFFSFLSCHLTLLFFTHYSDPSSRFGPFYHALISSYLHSVYPHFRASISIFAHPTLELNYTPEVERL